MGACCNVTDAQTKKVNAELKGAKQVDKYKKKLLFLGSGGSGKSTLFKQLRTIHGEGYLPEDRMTFITHIHAQVIEQMKLAIECVHELGIEDSQSNDETDYIASEEEKKQHQGLLQLSENAKIAVDLVQSVKDPKLTTAIAESIKVLWKEPEIQKIYEQRAIMAIEDTSAYFWDSIDRIMSDGYIPNEEDILLVRFRTTGVIEQSFTIQNNIFNVFDVGGQKSERKKWINCFDHVTAVIFVASLSCYDEVMFEQEDTNSMEDALILFEDICNEHAFENTSMILFLNKKDLFAQKIEHVPITVCRAFIEFENDSSLDIHSFDDTTNFIQNIFVSKNTSNEKSVFAHLTCATDEKNVSKVFNDVQHIIIENSLINAGLMGDGSDDMEDGEYSLS